MGDWVVFRGDLSGFIWNWNICILSWCFGGTEYVTVYHSECHSAVGLLGQQKCVITFICADLNVWRWIQTGFPRWGWEGFCWKVTKWWHQTWLWTSAWCQSHEEKDFLSIMTISLCDRYQARFEECGRARSTTSLRLLDSPCESNAALWLTPERPWSRGSHRGLLIQ